MMMCVRCVVDNGRLVLFPPDGSAEGLADAETNTDGNADDEDDEEHLGDNLLAAAQPRHVGAAALNLGGLGLFLPVILAGPDLTLALSGEVAALAGGGLGDEAGLDVAVKGVAVVLGVRGGRVDGHDADGGSGG